MALRIFAFFTGLGYGLMGVLSLIPTFVWDPEMPRPRQLEISYGRGFLGGFIPVNIPHSILWIAIGVGGIVASISYPAARAYACGLFVLLILLIFLGILPFGVNILWGFLPLDEWNLLVHVWTAILAWYFGFVHSYRPWETVPQ